MYLDKAWIYFKGVPKFLFDLTHFNFGFITTGYYLLVGLMCVIFVYFLVTVYTSLTNIIDEMFAKENIEIININSLLGLTRDEIFFKLGIKKIEELEEFYNRVKNMDSKVNVENLFSKNKK
jgi:hypothetical protein